jgi:hypothetical protein
VSLRAILDTTAVRAYAAGSIAVGELIGEFSDEGVQFGVPALCLVEAAIGADQHAVGLLTILAEHADAECLPLDPAQWPRLAAAAQLLGAVHRACASLPVALGEADYIVTADPDAYPGLDAIGI